MSAWQGMAPGTRVLILAAAGLLLLGTGYLGWQVLRLAPTPQPAAPVAVAADPTPAPQATPVPQALPKIDVWRVAPDGGAVVSGRAVMTRDGKTHRGLFTRILRRTVDRWLIVHDQLAWGPEA